jgi:hypothetical protein
MNCTGNSPAVLLPPILYKSTAFRLLQPQLEPSSVVWSSQKIAFAGYRHPLLSQAMQLPRHHYTAPWHGGEALRSIQGCLFRDIIKHISPPPALSQAALLRRRSSATPWRRGHFFRDILSRNIQPTALAGASLLPRRFYTTTRLSQNLDSIRKFLLQLGTMPGIFLPRRYFSASLGRDILRPTRGLFFFGSGNRVLSQSWQYRMASTRSVLHLARSYFGCFWKVTLAAAFINTR